MKIGNWNCIIDYAEDNNKNLSVWVSNNNEVEINIDVNNIVHTVLLTFKTEKEIREFISLLKIVDIKLEYIKIQERV